MLYTEAQKQEHIEEILTLLYQIALKDSRIPIVLPAKEFSEDAALAVRAFQEAYGLPVTGEIDNETWDAIVEAYHEITDEAQPLHLFPHGSFLMQSGDSGALVELVQVLLDIAARHYSNLPAVAVDGIYGTQTEQAVRALQKAASLPQTGIVNRETWNALAALVNSIRLGI